MKTIFPFHILIIANLAKYLFNRKTLISEIRKPYFMFNYIIKSQFFHKSNYKKPLSKDRIRLHNEIMRLHNKGWGYTKIYRHLLKIGYEIGKSRTTVDSIIKKIKKREEFLSQPIIDEIKNFRVEMLEFKYNLP